MIELTAPDTPSDTVSSSTSSHVFAAGWHLATYITPVLKELHWLPVRERVCFKIMLLVHRAVNCRGPVYLRDLICIYTPTRALLSEGTKQLKRPKTNCKAGDASFPEAAPDPWKRLPFSLRELCNENSFKNALKMLYFKQYFGSCRNN